MALLAGGGCAEEVMLGLIATMPELRSTPTIICHTVFLIPSVIARNFSSVNNDWRTTRCYYLRDKPPHSGATSSKTSKATGGAARASVIANAW